MVQCVIKGTFYFPDPFNTVAAHRLANRIWRMPMDYVARRLLGETDNDGLDEMPAEIVLYYPEIRASNSQLFSSSWTNNERHVERHGSKNSLRCGRRK